MSGISARDRRAPLFGSAAAVQSTGAMDIESLERQNDDAIAGLGERVGLLRNVTSGIQGEVHNHHAILDRMSQGMGGAQLGLGATVGKFKRVMDNPQKRSTVLTALGITAAIFFLYLWYR